MGVEEWALRSGWLLSGLKAGCGRSLPRPPTSAWPLSPTPSTHPGPTSAAKANTAAAPACLHLPQWPQASESQVAAAEALVQSLLMPHFESASIQNPALQRHFQVSGLGSE